MDERYIADLLRRAYDGLADEEAREERYLADLRRAGLRRARRGDAMPTRHSHANGYPMPSGRPHANGYPMPDGTPHARWGATQVGISHASGAKSEGDTMTDEERKTKLKLSKDARRLWEETEAAYSSVDSMGRRETFDRLRRRLEGLRW
jgi:hypothetical protein